MSCEQEAQIPYIKRQLNELCNPENPLSPLIGQAKLIMCVSLFEQIPKDIIKVCLKHSSDVKNKQGIERTIEQWNQSCKEGFSMGSNRVIALDQLKYFLARSEGCSDEEEAASRIILLEHYSITMGTEKQLEDRA
jgi:hypothetical protein